MRSTYFFLINFISVTYRNSIASLLNNDRIILKRRMCVASSSRLTYVYYTEYFSVLSGEVSNTSDTMYEKTLYYFLLF